jgi:hypothetical protein
MNLMEAWREIPIPSRKTQYERRHLLLLDNPYKYEKLRDWERSEVDLTDTVVWLTRRLNAKDTMNTSHDVSNWGPVRILRILWECGYCGHDHECFIPESWLEEGKAVFVEKVTTVKEEN